MRCCLIYIRWGGASPYVLDHFTLHSDSLVDVLTIRMVYSSYKKFNDYMGTITPKFNNYVSKKLGW